MSKTPFIVSIRVVNSKINLFAPKQKDLRVLYLLYSSLLTKTQSQWGSAGYTEGSNLKGTGSEHPRMIEQSGDF